MGSFLSDIKNYSTSWLPRSRIIQFHGLEHKQYKFSSVIQVNYSLMFEHGVNYFRMANHFHRIYSNTINMAMLFRMLAYSSLFCYQRHSIGRFSRAWRRLGSFRRLTFSHISTTCILSARYRACSATPKQMYLKQRFLFISLKTWRNKYFYHGQE